MNFNMIIKFRSRVVHVKFSIMAFGLILVLFLSLSLAPLYHTEDATCSGVDKSSLLHNSPSVTCSQLLEDFAKVCGDFITCALNYSKPMCLCDACFEKYKQMNTAHYTITNYTGDNTRESRCKQTLLDSDHLVVVRSTYQFAKSLWTKSHCKECHSSDQAVVKFYEKLDDLLRCWEEYIPIVPKNDSVLLDTTLLDSSDNEAVNHSICINCSNEYDNFTDYFKVYSSEHEDVCGDIMQHVNMTRLQWSQRFKCYLPKKNLFLVGIITGGFVALVVFFYCGVHLYGCLDERKEKRLLSVSSNSFATDSTDHSSRHVLREEGALRVRHTDIN